MSVYGLKAFAWVRLARPPFHLVGLLPFLLGSLAAWHLAGSLDAGILVLGLLGVFSIMTAAYFSGEYWDYREDSISASLGKSAFSGGSRVLQEGLLERRYALLGSFTGVGSALAIGTYLYMVRDTGMWTLPLGVVGIVGGLFYSARPIRWVSRGVGEIWIAFCYGWLPVAAGYYIQTGEMHPLIHWMSIPIALTIFNVILLNEFPDHTPDSLAEKRNLAVRLGLPRSAAVYSAVTVLSWAGFLLSLARGVPIAAIWPYAPVIIVSAWLVALVLRGAWLESGTLERMCGANIAVNLGTTAAYLVALLV